MSRDPALGGGGAAARIAAQAVIHAGRHQALAVRVEVHQVAQEGGGVQAVRPQVELPRGPLIAESRLVVGGQRRDPPVVHESAPIASAWFEPGRVRLLAEGCVVGHVVGLQQDLGGGALADAADDVLVFVVRPEDMEDQEVGPERVEVRLGGLDQQLGREATKGPVLDDQVGVRVPVAEAVGDRLPPSPFGDRLTIEEDAHHLGVLRRAGGEQAQRALDAEHGRKRRCELAR